MEKENEGGEGAAVLGHPVLDRGALLVGVAPDGSARRARAHGQQQRGAGGFRDLNAVLFMAAYFELQRVPYELHARHHGKLRNRCCLKLTAQLRGRAHKMKALCSDYIDPDSVVPRWPTDPLRQLFRAASLRLGAPDSDYAALLPAALAVALLARMLPQRGGAHLGRYARAVGAVEAYAEAECEEELAADAECFMRELLQHGGDAVVFALAELAVSTPALRGFIAERMLRPLARDRAWVRRAQPPRWCRAAHADAQALLLEAAESARSRLALLEQLAELQPCWLTAAQLAELHAARAERAARVERAERVARAAALRARHQAQVRALRQAQRRLAATRERMAALGIEPEDSADDGASGASGE